MKEKNGFIIYLDLLGYKNIINNKNDEESINELKEFIDKISQKDEVVDLLKTIIEKDFSQEKFKFRCYSDNFMYFYEADLKSDYLIIVGALASAIIGSALIEGFMLRGSIVYGKLMFNDNIVFGKSIIDAYELENNHLEPNVVLSPQLKLMYEEEKLYEIDLLSPFVISDKNNYQKGKNFFTGIEKLVRRLNLQSIVDERTLDKYRWLIKEYNRYFNNYCHIDFVEAPLHYEVVYKDSSDEI